MMVRRRACFLANTGRMSLPMESQNAAFAPNTSHVWTRREWIAASLAGVATAGCSRSSGGRQGNVDKGTIRILVWSDYFAGVTETIGPDGEMIRTDIQEAVITRFEKKTNIKIDITLFDSNEELYRLLTAEDAAFDIAMPSGFMVHQLNEEGWLRPILASAVPNSQFIDSRRFKLTFDPEMTLAFPYIWGSTGIAYNIEKVDGIPRHWSDLFDRSKKRDDEKIKIALLDDGRFTLSTALIYLGYSPSTRILAEIEAAGQLVRSLRSSVGSLESGMMAHKLAAGSIHLALTWSGHVTSAMQTNKSIRFQLPAAGSVMFKDCFVLPYTRAEKLAASSGKGVLWTERQEDAARFLNYLLEPEVAATVTNFSCFATTLTVARKFVHRKILNGAAYFLNANGKDFPLEQADTTNGDFQRVWSEVRSLWPKTPHKKR